MKKLTAIALSVFLLSVANAPAGDVQFDVQKGHVDLLVDGKLVGRYHTSTKYPKPIIWPLMAPGGVALTRDYPMGPASKGGSVDHKHHMSAWFCHGDVIPEGLEVKQKIRGIVGVDFWSVADGHGKIVCTMVAKPQTDKWKGNLLTKNEWRTADGTKIMDETRTIYLYDFGKAQLIVFDVDLHASVVPITFGDTKEGAMAVRVHDGISERRGNGVLQNAEGKKTEKQTWGLVSAWCDYSGTLDGKKVGLTLFADPKNVSPSCWHARGYGLLAANPFGRERARFPGAKDRKELVRLAKGDTLHLRYGILLHSGDATSGGVDGYYQRFLKLRDSEQAGRGN